MSTAGQITAAANVVPGQALRGANVVSTGTVTVTSGGISAATQTLTIGTVNASGQISGAADIVSGQTLRGAALITSGSVQAGGFPYTTSGTALAPSGINASLVDTVPSEPNWYMFRAGTSYTVGSPYVIFCAATGATIAGSITMNGAGQVAFNAASDYRLKDDLGPVVDPVGKLMALQPKHLRMKADQSEFDGFLAHEFAEVIPHGVTGAKDAVRPQDDPFDPGGIAPQQLDQKTAVPLLTAALQEAHTKIADLTARIEALEAAA